jgi:hypothetical protein
MVIIADCKLKANAALTQLRPAPDNYIMLPRIQPINPSRIAAPFDHEGVFE